MDLPRLFGDYLLLRQLARGTLSDVFFAQTVGDAARDCVIKRIRPDLAALPDFGERFRGEAELLVRLVHGNVVQVLEVGSVDEHPFVAMEHIEGIDLAELIGSTASAGPLPIEVALYIAFELCDAANYLFLRRRQASSSPRLTYDAAWPLELMVSFEGVVKVIDVGSFGALRLGQQKPTEIFNAPGYTAPEILQKGSLDSRTDVFTVGLTLWELLAGRRLVADDPHGYVHDVLSGRWTAPPLTRRDLPPPMPAIVQAMLARDPEHRPANVEEIRPQLTALLRELAPGYGRSQLAQWLVARCPAAIAESRALTLDRTSDSEARTTLLEHTRTRRVSPSHRRTLSYSHVGRAERTLRKPLPLKSGDRVPGTRYRIVGKLGEGGSAQVYAAQHVDLDRRVALKILSPELASHAEGIALFRLEARTCSRIGHPNIVDVTDFGELEDGRFYFTMELIDGRSLADVLYNETALSVQRALPIFRQIAQAVHAAHQAGIVHRDLKPENIMLVERDGRADFVKVLDFGVMAFDQQETRERVGTPGYMAPEQAARATPSPAMDIYALGATLYEVLSGSLPYDNSSTEAYIQALQGEPRPLHDHPRAKNLPPALAALVHRALAQDPTARPPSAATFERELANIQTDVGIRTPWDAFFALQLAQESDIPHWPPQKPSQRTPRRRSARSALWITSTLTLIALLGLLLLHRPPTPPDASSPPVVTLTASVAPSPAADHAAPSAPATDRYPAVQNAPSQRVKAAPRPSTPQKNTAKPASVPSTNRTALPSPQPETPPNPAPALEATRLVAEGQALLKQGKPLAAQQQFFAALKHDANHCEAILGLAEVAFEDAQYPRAVEYASRAVRICERPIEAQLLLGDAYYRLLRYADAFAAWQAVTALSPEHPRALSRIALLDPSQSQKR